MPNDWFQLKQFRIEQGRCAMKVSTDACIQGAWAAAFLAGNSRFRTALDIGTGTGILSLMVLQKSPHLFMTAVEREPQAARQARDNFAASPWRHSIKLIPESLKDWMDEQGKKEQSSQFDFIISNPPFFKNQLTAAADGRNMARHDALSAAELAGDISLLLNPEGYCCLMYPAREWPHWECCAMAAGLYPFHLLHVKPHAGKAANRIIGLFSKQEREPSKETLMIYEANGAYSDACSVLLKDYYLKL
jgi:tRNA1Val (adenine37-N6)-methyltransferase